MNRIYSYLISLAVLAFTALGQFSPSGSSFLQLSGTLVGATPNTLATNAYIVDSIVITPTTTNLTTVKLFDSASGTNMVLPAYTSYIQYATNVVFVYTNASSVILTNTYPGSWIQSVSNPASTNSYPVIGQWVTPGGGQQIATTRFQTINGLTLLSDFAASVQLNVRNVH